MVDMLQSLWANQYSRNPEIRIIVHTQKNGALDITPYVTSASWGNSIGQGAPEFEVHLNEPSQTVGGAALADLALGTPAEIAQWLHPNPTPLWRGIEQDWLQIHVDYGMFSAPNFLGWIHDRSIDAVSSAAGWEMRTTLKGESVASVLDLEVLQHPLLAGLPSFFNPWTPELDAAFGVGIPGAILTTALNQIFTPLGGSYPELPWSLVAPSGGFQGGIVEILDLLTEVSLTVDGRVREAGPRWLSPFDQRSARAFVQPYIGWPELTEMFFEYRPLVARPMSQVWALKLVYRQHPWSREEWLALPVTEVDWQQLQLSHGGGYYNYFDVDLTYLQEQSQALVGSSPFVPIANIPDIRRYGIHKLVPELRWIDPVLMAPTIAYQERWNRRLWDWWALGYQYLNGTIKLKGFRPDIRLGQRIKTNLPGQGEYSFYVENYRHTVTIDPNSGLATGNTDLAVSRGQPGDYLEPPIPLPTILKAEGA